MPKRPASIAMRGPGPLAGMPVALKDNIVTVEQPTTCGSRILEGYVSPYNATVVERLRAAGRHDRGQDQPRRVRHGLVHRALRVWAGASIRSIPTRVPGGSSGGSAALVAAGVVPGRAGLGDRRLGAAAGQLLRSGGRKAELWTGEPLWPGRVRLARSTASRSSAAPWMMPRGS